jgi:hypothetical protein
MKMWSVKMTGEVEKWPGQEAFFADLYPLIGREFWAQEMY